MTATDARPSTIGEILDRAIATYVRRCLPLFAILAVFAIPAALLEFYTQPGFTHLFDTMNRLIALPAGDSIGRARLLHDMNRSAAPGGWIALYYMVQLLIYPLARTAFVIFAAQTLDGVPVTIVTAYRQAVRRWLPQVVVALAFIGFAVVLGIGFFIAGAAATLSVIAVGLASRIAAAVAGVIVALVVLAAALVVVALAYIAWLMASVSVAIEDANPIRAIGRGLRRTLDRPLLRRTLAVALAVMALDGFGVLAIVSFAGIVAYLTHVQLFYAVIAAGAGILLDGVRTVFVLLYMRDVALRREGSDLLLAAAAPSPVV